MTAPFKTWTVLPHGKLTEVEEGILTVIGEIKLPVGEFPRRMTVVRLAGGGLVIYSAIALDEPEMDQLEAYGVPAFLIVPNDIHRQDAVIWKNRYPRMKVIAPQGSREKVQQIVPVDAVTADFADPTVDLVNVAGTEAHEAALVITRPAGATLVLNDVVGNVDVQGGFSGWVLRAMHFSGDEPQIPRPVKAKMIHDKGALQRQLRSWAELPDLKRILVSHGTIIDDDPARVLRKLASSLD